MTQELNLCLQGNIEKTVWASTCKIAFNTIPRCGIAALILLYMGLYFIFPACQTFQQIQTEKNTPYELTASTDSSIIDLNTIMQIEGVERISPVVNLNATLSLEEYKLDCEISAVYSSFLTLKFTQGAIYPDSSNMPYLILNKAAAKAFSNENQTVTVSPEDIVTINANGTERKASICGIFDDGSEAPTVYMSYDATQKEYGTNEQTELVFLLNNMGSAEDVVSALQRQNIYAIFNPNLTLAWELLLQQCWQTALLSISLLVCAVALIREKRSAEIIKARSETEMLLLTGMSADSVDRIFPLRIIYTCIPCALAVAIISVIMGTFSLMAMGVSIIAVSLIKVAVLI